MPLMPVIMTFVMGRAELSFLRKHHPTPAVLPNGSAGRREPGPEGNTMKLRSLSRRWAARGSVAAITAVTVAAGMQVAASAAVAHSAAAVATTRSAAASTADPYAPSYHHAYRRGAVPTRARARLMRTWAAQHPAAQPAATPSAAVANSPAKKKKKKPVSNKLVYGGGIDGIGVTTGPPQVYLVFWGSQWGTQGTDGNGDTTFSKDPSGEAPRLQEFFKGLGTGGERWSGVMTQYCDGTTTGATTCPPGSSVVGYPGGGALAGVWYDNSAAEPQTATGNDLANEAIAAAGHFGNHDQSANRNAQYVILSATGLNPDDWQNQGFCAWHDYNGDPTLTGGAATSPYGDIAFTNLPYQTDAGLSCGQNFVNPGSAGNLDGITIVEGHEYAETITDQNPPGGWTVPLSNKTWGGAENGDLCSWILPGTAGGGADLGLSTGTFAVQGTWANDLGTTGGCETGHNITGDASAGVVSVTGPGDQASLLNDSANLQISASETGKSSFTYSATGLPPGASVNPSTGAITGTLNTPGVYPVTVAASDGSGGSGQDTFTWTVNDQLLGNPGFENSTISPWTSTAGVLQQTPAYTPHSGSQLARLGGAVGKHTDTLSQKVTLNPFVTGNAATLSFWLNVQSNDPAKKASDTLKVEVVNSKNKVLTTLATFSNKTATGYALHSYSLSKYLGQTVTIKFIGTQKLAKHTTSFLVDDTALNIN